MEIEILMEILIINIIIISYFLNGINDHLSFLSDLVNLLQTVRSVLIRIRSKKIYHGTYLKKFHFKSEKIDMYKTYIDQCASDQFIDRNFYENIIETPGSKVHVWTIRNPNVKRTILYSHGNSHNMIYYLPHIKVLMQYGTVVTYDYRGFGQTKGKSETNGVLIDAMAVLDYLLEKSINPSKLILYGFSLGGSVSSYLASELTKRNTPPASLIIQSSFSSVYEMSPAKFMLICYLLPNELATKKYLEKVSKDTKILLMHSKTDTVVPYSHILTNISVLRRNRMNYRYLELFGYHGKVQNCDDYHRSLKWIFD
jgi:alpha/beta superfamily hydrolase